MSAIRILVDADACPVKDEIYRVAGRYRVPVTIVSNSPIRIPKDPLIDRVVVSDGFDAADDWIAEATAPGTLVVTADILLADRCLKRGATAPSPPARSWPTCAPAASNWVARGRFRKWTARASCRLWTRRWCS
jgi:uncharacterized protein YaiI (UPF0178 family)